ncbi:MAG: hypothetical protein IJ427_03000 [Lachnospiraceae bacterium]|nr:hypothetical protein [Lachnospiraceae bacterium]MBQ8547442.1 hypothetical protein [Lachnospiraceae bacterium]
MRNGRVYGIAALILLLLCFAACTEANAKQKEDKATPSIASEISKTPEEKDISVLLDGISGMLGIPTATPKPTATPVPTRKELISKYWMNDAYDACKVVECDEYYFEVISFAESQEGVYVLETVFENRQDFAVYLDIYAVNINGLRHPLGVWTTDWSQRMLAPGKKETVEFWIPDYYVEQLGITKAEDFSYICFSYEVSAVAELYFAYTDYGNIFFCPYGRDKAIPYEHVVEEDDIVLVDEKGVKLILTDFIYDIYGGYEVTFYWENNTDEYLRHHFYDVSVNGYMCSPFYYGANNDSSLSPGMCAYEQLYFYGSDLEECGITTVTEIALEARLFYDAGIWQWTDWVRDTFCVYPLGLEAAQKQEREPQDTDIFVFDTDEYRMVITGFLQKREMFLESEYTDYIIEAYVENKTDQEVQFVINNAEFNGEEYTAYYNYYSVSPGKAGYIELSWDEKGFGIENYPNLDSLELTVQIINLDDEKQSVVLEETFAVIP